MKKPIQNIFFILVCISVTAAFWVSKELLFPYVTTKAFIFRIGVELALPVYAFLLASNPKLRPSLKNPLNISVLAFVVLNIISSFSGVSVERSLWGNFERMGGSFYIAHLAALYFYVLALGQMSGLYLQRFLKFLLAVGAAVAINGVLGWLGLPTLVLDPSLPGRVSSTLGNPIYLGSFLIIPLFLSLFFARQAKKTGGQWVYYVLAVLCLWAIFLSGTRGSAIGLLSGSFLAAVVFLLLTPKEQVKRFGFAIVGLFVILALILFVYKDKLPQGSIVQRIFTLNDSNTKSRLLQAEVALDGFKDSPIFGTGPENYYVVANKYYNPEIYKYDASWFDKPHNYILEILVTNGIVGFIAYAALLFFTLLSFYKGYKAGLYGLGEFCFLLGAFLSYQIQNLSVFDTVPASLMFYSFAGFAAHIWRASTSIEEKSSAQKSQPQGLQVPGFAPAVFLVSAAVSAYAIYATEIVPIAVSKNVNYGFAYASIDSQKSYSYFKAATQSSFNFDKTETASKFADFATEAARVSNPIAPQAVDDATAYMKEAIAAQPDYPILWQKLSTLYLLRSTQAGGKIIVNPLAEEAIQTAIKLAPKRDEAKLALAQIRYLQGRLEEARVILEQAVEEFPTDRNAKSQLAFIYRAQGKTQAAVALMEESGYRFNSYSDIKWLVDYYVAKKEFAKAVSAQEQAAKLEPNNLEVFIQLAKLYALNGQIEAARTLAESISKFDASKKAEMEQFISSLPKTASSTPTE